MSRSLASTSRRALLQRELGDDGEVLARIVRGGGEYQAAGWYARIKGELVYLGDHVAVAIVTISKRAQNGKP